MSNNLAMSELLGLLSIKNWSSCHVSYLLAKGIGNEHLVVEAACTYNIQKRIGKSVEVVA